MTLSEEVEGVLQRAFEAAREAGHPEIMPEHIALELLVEDETASYLMRCGTDLVAVESRLREHLGSIEPDEEEAPDTRPGEDFQQVLDAAMERSEDDGRECVMLRDLFLALIDERESTASIAIVEATSDPEALEDLRNHPWEEE
jgi:ATP-dependent Clp protease ATP-binding subunit ClpA